MSQLVSVLAVHFEGQLAFRTLGLVVAVDLPAVVALLVEGAERVHLVVMVHQVAAVVAALPVLVAAVVVAVALLVPVAVVVVCLMLQVAVEVVGEVVE